MGHETRHFETTKQITGRPPYHPTPEDRDVVVAMAFAGFTQERIARAMGVAENTLRKHYHDELQRGTDRMLADVVRSLAAKACSGDTTACIWITKTRLGWREPPKQVEMAGPDGGSISLSGKNELVERILALTQQR